MRNPKTEPAITPVNGPAPAIIPTPHVDYHGNANLYLNTTPQATTLYELTGLDEQRWHIVGMNLHTGGNHADHRRDSVYIYAVDKLAQAKELILTVASRSYPSSAPTSPSKIFSITPPTSKSASGSHQWRTPFYGKPD